jgi:hypothetical protein
LDTLKKFKDLTKAIKKYKMPGYLGLVAEAVITISDVAELLGIIESSEDIILKKLDEIDNNINSLRNELFYKLNNLQKSLKNAHCTKNIKDQIDFIDLAWKKLVTIGKSKKNPISHKMHVIDF